MDKTYNNVITFIDVLHATFDVELGKISQTKENVRRVVKFRAAMETLAKLKEFLEHAGQHNLATKDYRNAAVAKLMEIVSND